MTTFTKLVVVEIDAKGPLAEGLTTNFGNKCFAWALQPWIEFPEAQQQMYDLVYHISYGEGQPDKRIFYSLLYAEADGLRETRPDRRVPDPTRRLFIGVERRIRSD